MIALAPLRGSLPGLEYLAGTTAAASRSSAVIAFGEAETIDPAAAVDAGSSALIAQLFESLTTVDSTLTVQPALAQSWETLDLGKRVVFHLRQNLTFSDGSSLTGTDVVRSWLRVLDPAHPSPLSALFADVEGATAYSTGKSSGSDSVGIKATGSGNLDVEIRLTRATTELPAIVASPTFAIVPISPRGGLGFPGGTFVGSGGYLLSKVGIDGYTLTANSHYWAGTASIRTISAKFDLGSAGPVQAFIDGDVDWTSIASGSASWIAWDRDLGPSLRHSGSLSTEYLGFNTTTAPFNDVRVRQAFSKAVDWARIVALGYGGAADPATSMVPTGIPGRATTSFLPVLDLAAARSLLKAAGYPNGTGFPAVTLQTTGGAFDAAIAAQLEKNLGVSVTVESYAFGTFFDRISNAKLWTMSWVADYPGPNDFLGLLLGSGETNNYGGWRSAAFDTAIAEARAASTAAEARAAYDRAETIVRDEAPVVPIGYPTSWSLSRSGLLGAGENGLGFIRLAGLAWGS